ncbi:MAG: Glycerol-3-phosphate dehydrogenase [NAD(P)+] [Alphaproteobacteria bacterium MarineAlpha5_Bin6]|nr:MAG: Glycerol-3-phosphate dehydrogenase [NAD(P)+] [Alphaproteobacteria bacterium MarineAlpha5_Bin7]PPR53717.1 MAG: Glycerol-3-phosphate dehydrogenase [NAD(P)+] [Alphaproteobacteria bacterium MarineAlpha5_Bin6]|tara:strand:+ start:1017 stop:2003 length:987 start_codon:yes stop_codon:yes gene_type:complete
MKTIGILGGGVWGSALAKLLSNHQVLIFSRDIKVVDSINKQKLNPRLKSTAFNDNVKATIEIKELATVDYLLIALPVQKIRETLKDFSVKNKNQQIIIGSKGIEINTKLFIKNVVSELVNTKNISIISGPCFSHEVAQNLPTAVTLASNSRDVFEDINNLFNNKNFRLYYSNDFIGCQLGGALKNIYAIAVGITNALNLGDNAKSALITRSFVEMTRLGNTLGANPQTLFGLSGLGDLILTCNSLKSRNTYFGYIIGSQQKISIEDHLKSQQTTEGYFTVKAVHSIANEKKIDMPIMNSIYNILYNGKNIDNEINNLLDRSAKKEIDQ